MTTTEQTTTEAKPARAKARTDITYWHDGRPMPGSHSHKLSTLAYFHSHDLDAHTPKRVPTKRFVAILFDAGVEKPYEPGWIVKLDNGITFECRIDGEASEYSGPVKAKKATAKKATTSSATSPTPRNAKGQIQSKKAKPPRNPAARADARKAAPAKATTSSARAKANVEPRLKSVK